MIAGLSTLFIIIVILSLGFSFLIFYITIRNRFINSKNAHWKEFHNIKIKIPNDGTTVITTYYRPGRESSINVINDFSITTHNENYSIDIDNPIIFWDRFINGDLTYKDLEFGKDDKNKITLIKYSAFTNYLSVLFTKLDSFLDKKYRGIWFNIKNPYLIEGIFNSYSTIILLPVVNNSVRIDETHMLYIIKAFLDYINKSNINFDIKNLSCEMLTINSLSDVILNYYN